MVYQDNPDDRKKLEANGKKGILLKKFILFNPFRKSLILV
jgi:hypothetical protein